MRDCTDASVVGVAGFVEPVRQMMELGEQRADMPERTGDDIEHRAGDIAAEPPARDARCARRSRTRTSPDIRPDLAGDEAQQRRFSGAVAPDDADALAALDRKIRVLEQQRAADRIVDVDEIDQRHEARRSNGSFILPLPCLFRYAARDVRAPPRAAIAASTTA